MKRVTGIGGIFFKAKDPEKLRAWYQKHLELEFDAYGSVVFDCTRGNVAFNESGRDARGPSNSGPVKAAGNGGLTSESKVKGTLNIAT